MVLGKANQVLEKLTGLRLVNARRDRIQTLATDGQIGPEEARFLGRLVSESDPSRPIVEIGTLFGWSTLLICLFKHPDQQLITVDNYSWNPLGLSPQQHFAVTTARLAPLVERHNVQQLRTEKDRFYADYRGPRPSLFFCDADHEFQPTLDDLRWAASVGCDVICGDDYSAERFPGVVRAVEMMGGASRVVDELFVLDSAATPEPV